MASRFAFGLALLALAIVGLVMFPEAWSSRVAAIAAGVLILVLMTRRCAHRHATLLPPVKGAGPDRDHARWYCDRCGVTWDATLEPVSRPRLIYNGYDESKAVRAAARADALEEQRRRLAVRRAGWAAPPTRPDRPAATRASGPRPLEVLPMRRMRD
jgi:hypothetical protein